MLQFAKNNQHKIMNTFFKKLDKYLAIYKEKGQFRTEVVERYEINREYNMEKSSYENRRKYKFETLDYVTTHDKWKNTIKNIESDMKGKLIKANADHFPLNDTISIRLKGMKKKQQKSSKKLGNITQDGRMEYNAERNAVF